ncbi:uncharacterized protein BX664DRAFT_313934 [Halteromyces radiatus]|uniref:uncharacterized protein n=1 Tax=Halteromyces radiatus TaxID=101107 RepID=UPI0022204FBB|nr:uncharacterized protein BX664DRAFT_313934 [Halteromyces radiatus]KAI8088651.1 hypothetical protein BX664DRAFT_313934 [Halteromyces radiatus]
MQMPGQIRGSPVPQQHYVQNPVPYRNPIHQETTRKRSHKSSSRQAVPQQQEDNEPSGDELDDISARDIAMARYKRNHDYFSEIFTPYNADSIEPPPLDISQSKEELLRLIDEQKQKSKEQQEEHENRLDQFRQERDQFWKSLANLKEATSIEAIDKAAQAMAETINGKVEHNTENVNVIQIPGLKEEPILPPTQPQTPHQPSTSTSSQGTPNQQQQQQHKVEEEKGNETNNNDVDMFTNFDENTDDNNDFFNEMVNTGQDDDDPSVSEFLNSDMDFEQPEKQDDDMQE